MNCSVGAIKVLSFKFWRPTSYGLSAKCSAPMRNTLLQGAISDIGHILLVQALDHLE